ISLVCLNLPPDIRYSSEHMHVVGILPHQSETDAQEYLVPLVDELLTLWHVGVVIPRTALSDCGRLVRAAVVPVVCDMPGGRKVVGYNPPRSNYLCPYCKCHKSQINSVGIYNDDFVRRSREEWLLRARNWRDARSNEERARLKSQFGIAWSELLYLPYWDPTKYFVVDGMHNLVLGLLQHHIRVIWG
ncbi:hypothetical protein AURDEDRAFT_39797, partial [Auricularia subglabra TFB-10046 SS5]